MNWCRLAQQCWEFTLAMHIHQMVSDVIIAYDYLIAQLASACVLLYPSSFHTPHMMSHTSSLFQHFTPLRTRTRTRARHVLTSLKYCSCVSANATSQRLRLTHAAVQVRRLLSYTPRGSFSTLDTTPNVVKVPFQNERAKVRSRRVACTVWTPTCSPRSMPRGLGARDPPS